ncbi:sulfite exporter TauE/SafE family protein [Thermocrinis minervae]|uniref:Probable membrane transporter protein n=1 Tax=Thermocrinis minervae TaxID=381751 RepID=A0A1M6TGM7_9AQUI|nr:sulfite exporter TauE/SafE family protein [Thermocrinis minervae]SHK56054.1 hypothetical protein SAMN05444391_1451 [Thermocrinis minervae]
MSEHKELLVILSSFVAGLVNAIAGGGTLLTFPTLVFAGLDPISANVTNTVALWLGPLFGALGFRKHLERSYLKKLVVPSLLGGLVGAVLLILTPQKTFELIVPFLILFASIILALKSKITKLVERYRLPYPIVFVAVFLSAVYGGYFGAGLGILMLASLSLLGIVNIHAANAIKNLLGFLINLVASVYFAFSGKVYWHYVFVMMGTFALGGYIGALLAQKMDKKKVEAFIILWGFFLSVIFFLRLV